MTPQTEQLIRDLALKFGTTAEHLWGVMLRQAFIDAVAWSVILVILFAVLLVSAFGILRLRVRWLADDTFYDSEELVYGLWCVWCVVLIIVVGVALSCVPYIVSGFLNPEFWALNQFIR